MSGDGLEDLWMYDGRGIKLLNTKGLTPQQQEEILRYYLDPEYRREIDVIYALGAW